MRKFDDIYEDMIDMLKNEKTFSMVRYGDGEWATILKNDLFHRHLLTRWGDDLYPVSERLRAIVESKPRYYFGIQNLAYTSWPDAIDPMIEGFLCFNSDILHNRSISNSLSDFFQSLSSRNVIMVGPEYLKDISLFNIERHIVTPEYHVWNHIDELADKIRTCIEDSEILNPVLLYSCSLAAKILIDIFSKENITQIDVGSLLDPYVGVNSRSYHPTVINRLGIDNVRNKPNDLPDDSNKK